MITLLDAVELHQECSRSQARRFIEQGAVCLMFADECGENIEKKEFLKHKATDPKMTLDRKFKMVVSKDWRTFACVNPVGAKYACGRLFKGVVPMPKDEYVMNDEKGFCDVRLGNEVLDDMTEAEAAATITDWEEIRVPMLVAAD